MPSSASLCVDCQSNPSEVEIRKRQLCLNCFRRYASSKVLKRMDTYRFKNQVGNQKKRLLLPLSGGMSSLVLLQILDAQIKRQLSQQNRSAYDLVLCHVVSFSPDQQRIDTNADADAEKGRAWWNAINTTFDLHTQLPVIPLHDVLAYDEHIEDDLRLLGPMRREGEDNAAFFDSALRSVGTATARSDLLAILLKRLLIGIARRNDCQAILWGHSDSALAALALSLVAKGRGDAVSTELADGLSPWGVGFNYPLRDLYRSELELFVQDSSESLLDCLLERPEEKRKEITVSLRLTSIDQLLGNYIDGQGEKYPSIVANVVKTAGKLQIANVHKERRCQICAAAVERQEPEEHLCYGCIRMRQDIRF